MSNSSQTQPVPVAQPPASLPPDPPPSAPQEEGTTSFIKIIKEKIGIITPLGGAIGIVISVLAYLYELGQYDYFQVDADWISVDSLPSLLYSLIKPLCIAVIALIPTMITALPFFIKAPIHNICLYEIGWFALSYGFLLSLIVSQLSIVSWGTFFLLAELILGFIYLMFLISALNYPLDKNAGRSPSAGPSGSPPPSAGPSGNALPNNAPNGNQNQNKRMSKTTFWIICSVLLLLYVGLIVLSFCFSKVTVKNVFEIACIGLIIWGIGVGIPILFAGMSKFYDWIEKKLLGSRQTSTGNSASNSTGNSASNSTVNSASNSTGNSANNSTGNSTNNSTGNYPKEQEKQIWVIMAVAAMILFAFSGLFTYSFGSSKAQDTREFTIIYLDEMKTYDNLEARLATISDSVEYDKKLSDASSDQEKEKLLLEEIEQEYTENYPYIQVIQDDDKNVLRRVVNAYVIMASNDDTCIVFNAYVDKENNVLYYFSSEQSIIKKNDYAVHVIEFEEVSAAD